LGFGWVGVDGLPCQPLSMPPLYTYMYIYNIKYTPIRTSYKNATHTAAAHTHTHTHTQHTNQPTTKRTKANEGGLAPRHQGLHQLLPLTLLPVPLPPRHDDGEEAEEEWVPEATGGFDGAEEAVCNGVLVFLKIFFVVNK
jgi:hypothetical protein